MRNKGAKFICTNSPAHLRISVKTEEPRVPDSPWLRTGDSPRTPRHVEKIPCQTRFLHPANLNRAENASGGRQLARSTSHTACLTRERGLAPVADRTLHPSDPQNSGVAAGPPRLRTGPHIADLGEDPHPQFQAPVVLNASRFRATAKSRSPLADPCKSGAVCLHG